MSTINRIVGPGSRLTKSFHDKKTQDTHYNDQELTSSSHSNDSGGRSATQQFTRHARRLYFGGIPSKHADEEMFKTFLNSVISAGLNEDNDHSYIITVYVNPKKFFAFVELKSIELTTACLDLDGIVYYGNPNSTLM